MITVRLLRLFVVFSLTIVSNSALAQQAPNLIHFQGQIVDTSDQPLEGASVSFTLQLTNPLGTCVLYQETQTLNMTGSNGIFDLTLGSGTVSTSSPAPSPTIPLAQAFSNQNPLTGLSCGGGIYTPAGGDGRALKVTFNDGNQTETLASALVIASVPYALYANSLQGKLPSDFIAANSVTAALTQANLESVFDSAASVTKLTQLITGNSTEYAKASSATGTSLSVYAGAPTAPSQGSVWLDTGSGQLNYYNGTTTQVLSTSGGSGTITALTGDISASGSGSVAASVDKVGGSTSANVHAAELLANAATNANSPNTIVMRDGSGNFSAGLVTANLTGAASLNVLKAGDSMTGNLSFDASHGGVFAGGSGSNTVTVEGPSSAISTSYVLRLPAAVATVANQVLTSDTSGNLSWTTPSSAATSYTGTLPVTNGGTNSSTALTGSKVMVSNAGATGIVEGPATSTLQTTSLADTKVWIGNGSGVATALALNGDALLDDTGKVTVQKLQGKAVSSTLPTIAGQTLRYDGSTWTPNFISMADLRSTITGSSALTACTSGQTLTWSALTDNLACANIAVTGANFASQTANTFLAAPNGAGGAPAFRGIASADLPTGTLSGSGTAGYLPYYSAASTLANSPVYTTGGNVGVGTTTPSAALHIKNLNAALNSFVVDANGGTQFKIDAYGNAYFVGGMKADYDGTLGVSRLSNTDHIAIETSLANKNILLLPATGGNVGIGNANPMSALDVTGNAAVSGNLYANSVSGYTGTFTNLVGTQAIGANGGTAGYWGRVARINITTQYMYYSSQFKISGRYGTNAQAFLNIRQDAAMGGLPSITLQLDSANSQLLKSDIVAVTTTNSVSLTTVDLYIHTTNDYEQFYYQPVGTLNGYIGTVDYSPQTLVASLPSGVQTTAGAGQSLWTITSGSSITYSGNVGVGTTSPQATLDINGDIRLKKNSAAPIACSSTYDGRLALTSQYTTCVCKGTSSAWVKTIDGSTACLW